MSRTRATAYAVVAAIVLIALIVIIYIVKYNTADARGAVDQRERTRADGNYRIANYDRFYDECGSIQALEDQIANAKAATSLPADQRDVNILALKNQRASLIRQYNADASKADTRAHFLASDLPYRIDINSETTTCAP